MPINKAARDEANASARTTRTVEEIARKNADPAHSVSTEESAVVNSASQTEDPGLTDRIKRARGEGVANLSQGENTNGEADAKEQEPDFSKATLSVSSSGEKILREEGAPLDLSHQGHVVQQGGGGVVAPSGEPIR
jgi:hypothetical protein